MIQILTTCSCLLERKRCPTDELLALLLFSRRQITLRPLSRGRYQCAEDFGFKWSQTGHANQSGCSDRDESGPTFIVTMTIRICFRLNPGSLPLAISSSPARKFKWRAQVKSSSRNNGGTANGGHDTSLAADILDYDHCCKRSAGGRYPRL